MRVFDSSVYFSNGKFYVSLNSESFNSKEDALKYLEEVKKEYLLSQTRNHKYITIENDDQQLHN